MCFYQISLVKVGALQSSTLETVWDGFNVVPGDLVELVRSRDDATLWHQFNGIKASFSFACLHKIRLTDRQFTICHAAKVNKRQFTTMFDVDGTIASSYSGNTSKVVGSYLMKKS